MDGNYVAILAFAWAYILSACWVERLESSSSLHTDADSATATGCQPRIRYTRRKLRLSSPSTRKTAALASLTASTST